MRRFSFHSARVSKPLFVRAVSFPLLIANCLQLGRTKKPLSEKKTRKLELIFFSQGKKYLAKRKPEAQGERGKKQGQMIKGLRISANARFDSFDEGYLPLAIPTTRLAPSARIR